MSPAGALRISRAGGRRWAAPALLVVLGLLLHASCASYTTRLSPLRGVAAGGGLDEALALIEKHGETGELLYHLEKGTLLHYLQRYEESNLEFDRAAEVYADRYTVSLSQRGLTFLLNDEVEAYAGELHEGNYLHYYRILNYLALGDAQGAAVEARRLALRLTELRDREGRDLDECGDPFLEYVTGVALESIGEWNSALIAYRRAKEGYLAAGRELGIAAPPWLGDDILRTARRAGIDPREIGIDARGALGEWPADRAQLVVVIEHGWPARKVSEHLRIPIFKRDQRAGDAAEASGAGLHLARRYRYHRLHGSWSDSPYKVDYFLDVAVPVLASEDDERISAGRVIVHAASSDAFATATRARVEMVVAADLGALVERAFARDELGVLGKAFARALLKYAAHRQAEKQWGVLGGLLSNLAGAATEKADTRGWLLLPGEIRLARLDLAAGAHRVVLEALDEQGRLVEAATRRIELYPGEIGVVTWRSFR